MLANESEQMIRPAFLLALAHERDRQRQTAGHRFEGATGLDEGHQLPFVVARAAGDDGLAARSEILDARLERRGLPQIERIDRLHVVMAIEQRSRARSVAALADHDRLTGGPPDTSLPRSRSPRPPPD